MKVRIPEWLNPAPALGTAHAATPADVDQALTCEAPGLFEYACLISDAADQRLEAMAARAQALTTRHFGRTISLYAPLYLSNYCSGGCVYCGFAADRRQVRHKLSPAEQQHEMSAMRRLGIDDVLLLTGERHPEADFNFLLEGSRAAAARFSHVAIESFAMPQEEYAALVAAGCSGMTLYQETYNPALYHTLHRWGPKRDYSFRLDAPARALAAGFRTAGIGALLGLGDPFFDAIALYRHASFLRKRFWQAGVMVSFPRLCREHGGFEAVHDVSDRMLARFIFAFRIAMPEVPLVLSTRESSAFRDGMAGIGISRMSIASRTSVGGYHAKTRRTGGQFEVSDSRTGPEFCRALRSRGLEPVFKNWDAVFHAG